MSGNHLADQADKERERAGSCPACGKGITEPAEWCPHTDQECEPNMCPVSEGCFSAVAAVKCPKCGWIKKEE